MPRPLIGVTVYSSQNTAGQPTAAVQTSYLNAIRGAGGLPVLLPNVLSEDELLELYSRLGGILFTGGGDIRTSRFQGTDHPRVAEVDDARDELELRLLRAAVRDAKPFLGICRGLQVANVALGGTLYTDISDQHPGSLRHDWYPDIPRTHLAHPVRIEEGSHIGEILNEPLLRVNSLHHQAVKDLSTELAATAYAPDGIIEAVELRNHPFGLAVQWHPEWLTDQPAMRRLFGSFVQAASEH